jgi:hypothetical protein
MRDTLLNGTRTITDRQTDRQTKPTRKITWGICRSHRPNSQAAKIKKGAVHSHDVELNSEIKM